jgi:hypothetical protein
MPRLNPSFIRSTIFLYEKGPDGELLPEPCGSGVIVGIFDRATPAVFHFYAVTAAHVALTGGSVVMLNTRDRKRRPMEFDPAEWTANREKEDLAVVDITDRIKVAKDGDEISYVPLDLFATQDFLNYVEFDVGEDGFMLGLFSGQPGIDRNAVAARFGNVSLLADKTSPIERPNTIIGGDSKFSSPCHVFDMHSRPGFSGSPVFVYRTPDGDLRDMSRKETRRAVRLPVMDSGRGRLRGATQSVEMVEVDYDNNRFLRLFGIHVAQFYDEVEVTKVNAGAEKKGKGAGPIKDGDAIRFPGSMSIIVPAWEILKLLECPDLKKQREDRKERKRRDDLNDPKRGAVVLESRTETKVALEPDNPSHKEDFTSLLNAAAKSHKTSGQT